MGKIFFIGAIFIFGIYYCSSTDAMYQDESYEGFQNIEIISTNITPQGSSVTIRNLTDQSIDNIEIKYAYWYSPQSSSRNLYLRSPEGFILRQGAQTTLVNNSSYNYTENRTSTRYRFHYKFIGLSFKEVPF